MSNTLSKVLILLVLLAAIGGGVYYFFLRPKPTPPSNGGTTPPTTECEKPGTKEGWCLYENKELSFSFEYPKEWGEVEFSIYPGDKGYVLEGRFDKKDLLAAFRVHTTDWSRSIGIGPTFVYFTNKSNDEYNYHHVKNGEILATFKATKIINLNGGGKALVVSGKDLSDLNYQLSSGSSTTGVKDRLAFINIASSYEGSPAKGLEFYYKDIPAGEVENFDAIVASFRR